MSSRTTPSLVVAVAALVVGAAGVFALVRWQPGAPTPIERVDSTSPEPVAPAPADTDVELAGSDANQRASDTPEPSLETTVAFPLVVQVDLLEDRSLPAVPAGPPLGSGRSARLAGRIADARGNGVVASVTFVAGPNQGRVLRCDENGRYGANDLLPGLDIVEVRGAGILGSRREVRLRQDKEFLLNIGYGRPATVQGRVVDEDGDPVVGANVVLDGLVATTDENGDFFYIEVAAGRCLFEVSKEGFAAYRTELGVASASRIDPGALVVALRRPAALRLVLRPDIGGPEPAHIVLTPARTNYERTFPWHDLGPIELTGGAPVVVNDLPEGPLHVRAYRSGAVARPEYRQVQLNAGVETEVVVVLEPAPVVAGTVFGPDGAVPGARVTITAADVARATQRHYATSDELWLEDVLPLLPAARQSVVCDSNGRFRATSWSNLSPYRLLEIESPDGALALARVIGPDDDDRELELQLVPRGEPATARLVVRLPDRFQALPVDVAVSGAWRERLVVAADRDLVIDGLRPGVHRVRAAWQGERVALEAELEIDDHARLTWILPLEAIDGQDEDTWNRLGRVMPNVPEARRRAEARAAASGG